MTATKRKDLEKLVTWLRLPEGKGGRGDFWAVPASLKERWAGLVEEVIAGNEKPSEGRSDVEDSRTADGPVEVDAGVYEA